jgi:hypothetical protein
MKRFILNNFAFAIFAMLVYVVLIILSGLYAPGFLKKNLLYKRGVRGYSYTRLQEAANTRNVNILFVGSSHCMRGYDTRIFNLKNQKAFNLGSSGQTPLQTELLLNEYLERLNPQIVIFDIYPALFGLDGVESGINIINNGTISMNTFYMAIKINSIRIYNTLVYAFFRQIFKLDKNFKEPKTKDGDTYVKGGYIETHRKYKSNSNINPEIVTISLNQLKAFSRILEKLKKRNIAVVLVQSPMREKKYYSFKNNDEMDSLLMRYGQYYNFNKMLTLPDSMFYDDGHLNQTGVNIFNRKLIEVLNLPVKKTEGYNDTPQTLQ